MVFVHFPVGENQDVRPLADGAVHFDEQIVHCLVEARVLIIGNRNLRHLEAFHVHVLDFQQVRVGENRVVHLQHLAVLFLFLQEVAVRPDVNGRRRHHFLADGVNRRVCHLGEQLLEIAKQRMAVFRQYRQRDVDTHGRRALAPGFRHI